MEPVERVLSAEIIAALTDWPRIVHAVQPEPVDLTSLRSFLNEMLRELPWWDHAWQVTRVEPARPHEVAGDGPRRRTTCTEVSVPGVVTGDREQVLPFSARIRFENDRLLRFQAKIGDVVIGPATAPAGAFEPHPFGAVFSKLMDRRGISIREMAVRCLRAMSTISSLRHGVLNPHRVLVHEVARALEMSEEDLAAIAGLDDIESAPARSDGSTS
ncbi:helix-turn-helix domain-containing protein [Rugosimonospora africana]|uniref:HTH cro/C1-type domain-containing protein n=1 Tax=Rugosimonospora africana TaxID=556532 RepID=A0A8J3R2R7_9ACTN|nr:helix-turn-helix transcriptional regulator [Rugosimonospora africana]GIH21363.1 hypothetical protein Raf01_95350 [Rugosimonospora africana]